MKTIDILAAVQPYRSSPVFTAATLPQGLQREHRTKAGVWAQIRILAGALQYDPMDGTPPYLLTPTRWVTVAPQEAHLVQLVGPVELQIDFFDQPPLEDARRTF